MSNRTLENPVDSGCGAQKLGLYSEHIGIELAKDFYSVVEKIIGICHELAQSMESLKKCHNDSSLSDEIGPLNKFIKTYQKHYFKLIKEYNKSAQKVGLKPIGSPEEQEELLRNLTSDAKTRIRTNIGRRTKPTYKWMTAREFILKTIEKLWPDGLIVSIQILYRNFLTHKDL